MFLGPAVNSSNLVHRVVPGRPGPGRPSAVKVRIHQHGEFAVAICQDTPNLSKVTAARSQGTFTKGLEVENPGATRRFLSFSPVKLKLNRSPCQPRLAKLTWQRKNLHMVQSAGTQ